jgi:hypothetical protein
MPGVVVLQLLRVNAVTEPVAVPPAAGLDVTVMLRLDPLQVIGPRLAVVPDFRPELSVSLTETGTPPSALTVSTADGAAETMHLIYTCQCITETMMGPTGTVVRDFRL